ncbi:MAG: TetR/AcrR family transcriptional regulator, partial [Acidimicrobiales bacterium]
MDLIAEQGYDATTIEGVARRAGASRATVYRRWASKAEMVVDALDFLSAHDLRPAALDTGSLRGDLERLCTSLADEAGGRTFAVMRGVAARLSCDAELFAAFQEGFVAPRRAAIAAMLARAVQRGEMAPGRDVELLTSVIPALYLHRLLTTNEPPRSDFARRILDEVLIPAATAGAPAATSGET